MHHEVKHTFSMGHTVELQGVMIMAWSIVDFLFIYLMFFEQAHKELRAY